jgi:LmbE family N-acetylglucosaminyl deacetylase
MSKKNVLVIGAHPDDEVLGAGGTMAKHVDAGDEVHVLIVTEGTTQQYDDDSIIEQKRHEARNCADVLGIEAVHFGDLPDMRLDDVPHVEINAVIESAISELSPDIVYTHSPHEVNLDHKAVYDSTLVATRPATDVSRVLAYETPSSTGWTGGTTAQFGADVYIDISGYVEIKIEAFSAYNSEARSFPHPRSGKSLSARATTRGSEAGFTAAEAFSLVYERVQKV